MNRNKYEDIKIKANKWKDHAEELKEINTDLTDQINDLTEQLQEHIDNINRLSDENITLNNEFRKFKHKIKTNNFENQREILKKDAEIDRLTHSLDDYKDRYKEIREDCKELRKINNKTV